MSESLEVTPEFNFDAQVGEPAAPAETTAPTDSSAQGDNPAWSELLGVLPQEFQTLAKPHLRKWDEGVNQRFTKIREEATAPYQPYQQFVDQKVDPQELSAAYQVWDRLNNSPVEMFNQMKSLLQQQGLLPADDAALEGEVVPTEEDPVQQQLQQLAAQQQAFMEAMQQAKMAEIQQQESAKIDAQLSSELQQLESVTGKIPEPILEEVYNRASMLTDLYRRPVSLIEAFQNLQQLQQQFVQNRPGPNAPRVVPSGGGFPAPQVDRSALSSEEGRSAAIAAIIARNNAS